MLDRRELLKLAALAAAGCATAPARNDEAAYVNDVHSQINSTYVSRIRRPRSVDELRRLMGSTSGDFSIAGGRHAMGGQQFAEHTTLLDTTAMTHVLGLDEHSGVVDVEAGIQWPELVAQSSSSTWGIRQKQTGADRLSLGGALAANVHGRGLTMKPIIGDVESFVLLDPGGEAIECSRTKNQELFAYVIGGYGLFGVVASVRLRLSPRQKVRRVVELETIENLMRRFDERIAAGFLYGDFQFSINHSSENFLRKGVFSCYEPVPGDTPIHAQAELKPEDWMRLLQLAHADKEQAFERYAGYYLSTNGQVYLSDQHQLSFYPDDYHRTLDPLLRRADVPSASRGRTRRPPSNSRATEMITELYVPRTRLAELMQAAAEELRRRQTNVVYGTVRLIERDDESFLAWAKQPYACVIFNLHFAHDPAGMARAADDFRALIDLALAREGSYFLTYHRWARREQVERAYPQFHAFLKAKQRFDPRQRFQSEWYRHYARMFAL
ncbi:MAG TPA: FAD-binding oxidoreductase [Thermoanaerobaculia bacterium]|nr:FAD-binding oxidoreductase [Thermoanaerobaculia bacterium]